MRASPGGTTRTAEYISPTKAEILQDLQGLEDWFDVTDEATLADELAYERFSRRNEALGKVPGQQTDAQSSVVARAKRATGVPPASRVKRADRKPHG